MLPLARFHIPLRSAYTLARSATTRPRTPLRPSPSTLLSTSVWKRFNTIGKVYPEVTPDEHLPYYAPKGVATRGTRLDGTYNVAGWG